jgi:hypothetical protein
MAAGAGTCGACYWLTPSLNSDTPDVYPMQEAGTPLPHQNWNSASGKPTYAGLTTQLNGIGGATPLKSFYKNHCSSAQNSFETVGSISSFLHVSPPTVPPSSGDIIAVKSISPAFVAPQEADMYYPRMVGNRQPIMCPNGDCTTAHTCNNQNPDNCAVTVLDHYTTSFNWAEQNFSAIWLRTNWYLLTDSAITDVQTAGLTFVSGGDFIRSSIPEGYWDLVGNTLFIGETQKTNPYAYDIGPFNADSAKLESTVKCASFTDACLNVAQGIILPLTNFGTGQRLFNIYDGPVYQDSNGFLDITTTRGCTTDNGCIYLNVQGVRNNPAPGTTSYLANAAIGDNHLPRLRGDGHEQQRLRLLSERRAADLRLRPPADRCRSAAREQADPDGVCAIPEPDRPGRPMVQGLHSAVLLWRQAVPAVADGNHARPECETGTHPGDQGVAGMDQCGVRNDAIEPRLAV